MNNPRMGLGRSPDGHGLRKGICPGEGAVREVAAYLLDHQVLSPPPRRVVVSPERTSPELIRVPDCALELGGPSACTTPAMTEAPSLPPSTIDHHPPVVGHTSELSKSALLERDASAHCIGDTSAIHADAKLLPGTLSW